MDQTELNKILDQGEGILIEFKEAQNRVPVLFYDTVCAFLNHEGGEILLGVGDDGTALGLSRQNINNLKQDIVTALNNPDVLSPIFPLAVEEAEHPNGTELVSNIIIHREYNNTLPTKVIIHDNRVEAINPSCPQFREPLNLDTFEAEPKNPRGSRQEKREQLTQKRTRIFQAVFLLITLHVSIEEPADILRYKKKDSLREGYLKLLRDHKLIEYSIAQANTPNQPYRITHRGINLLMESMI